MSGSTCSRRPDVSVINVWRARPVSPYASRVPSGDSPGHAAATVATVVAAPPAADTRWIDPITCCSAGFNGRQLQPGSHATGRLTPMYSVLLSGVQRI